MKRDDEYLRKLLFEFEEIEEWLFMMPGLTLDSSFEDRREQYHILLMIDAGLAIEVGRSTFRVTNKGHDFLEAIRDEGIWNKTKAAVAETGGSATLEIFTALAKGFLKKKIEDHTGIAL